jgi:acetyltransferase-like isoleucine patch superfamily enzyme
VNRFDRIAAHRRGRKMLRETARLMRPPLPRTFASYGAGSVIVPPARIGSPECITIGDNVTIHENVWLEVKRRPGAPAPRLTIGSRTMLNRFVKIVCLGEVTLEEGALLADRAYVSDVDYLPGDADTHPDDRPLTAPAPVLIRSGAMVGVGAIVKPGVTIGRLAYIAAGAVVSSDVPDFCLAAGSPARVVRRFTPDE